MVLPFEINPYVKAYHSRAFPLGIIQANEKEHILDWICEKYINCSFDEYSYGMKFDISTYDAWGNKDRVTFSQTISLEKKLYDILKIDIIDLIKKLLDQRCYVHGGYNEKYIPAKRAYNRYECPHDYMIIGYDDMDKQFISVGYTKTGQFEKFIINYCDFLNSLDKQHIEINTCKFNDNYKFTFNKQRVIDELDDYVNSRTTKQPIYTNKSYGLLAINKLKKFFCNQSLKGLNFDVKYARAFLEHRTLMNIRVRYINDNIVELMEDMVNAYETSYALAKKMFMLGLKDGMKKDENFPVMITDIMEKIIEIDIYYIPILINKLRNE